MEANPSSPPISNSITMPIVQIESEVTAIIKTFERPDYLRRLVRSVKKFYPGLHIIVADDSFEPRPVADVEYIQLPADSGISVGRNALLKRVKTPYFLLLDDDFEFVRTTRIEQLLATVKRFEIDLAAGECIRCKDKKLWIRKRQEPYFGVIECSGSHLKLTAGRRSIVPGLTRCDIVPNFFVASTKSIRGMGGWACELKVNEHEEFFFRFKQCGLKAAYCPDVTVRHWFARSPGYTPYRDRDFWPLAAQLMGITRFTDMSGHIRAFPTVRAA